MNRICDVCHKEYDDAERFTFCPHERFMSKAEAAQKDKGIALIGHNVRFAHTEGPPYYRVQSCGRTGMVTLDGFVGEFAPHLFVIEETS